MRGNAAALVALSLAASSARAATYRPMADADLTAEAPVVVRARVQTVSVRTELLEGSPVPFTIVTLERLESFRGSVGPVFSLRLPGGRDGDRVWWIPGVPRFAAGEEVVLMLAPNGRAEGEYRLTEMGLSKFEVVADASGRRFVRRSVFSANQDLLVAKRVPVLDGPIARDSESFFAFLRSVIGGDSTATVSWAKPAPSSRSKWVNLGARNQATATDHHVSSGGSGIPATRRPESLRSTEHSRI